MSFARRAGSVLLALTFVGSSATLAMARDRDDHCEERVRKAEDKLRRDEQKHGDHSRQGEKDRHEVVEARAKCGHDRDHDHH